MQCRIDLLGSILIPTLMLVLLAGCEAKKAAPTPPEKVSAPTTMNDHHPPVRTPEN